MYAVGRIYYAPHVALRTAVYSLGFGMDNFAFRTHFILYDTPQTKEERRKGVRALVEPESFHGRNVWDVRRFRVMEERLDACYGRFE